MAFSGGSKQFIPFGGIGQAVQSQPTSSIPSLNLGRGLTNPTTTASTGLLSFSNPAATSVTNVRTAAPQVSFAASNPASVISSSFSFGNPNQSSLITSTAGAGRMTLGFSGGITAPAGGSTLGAATSSLPVTLPTFGIATISSSTAGTGTTPFSFSAVTKEAAAPATQLPTFGLSTNLQTATTTTTMTTASVTGFSFGAGATGSFNMTKLATATAVPSASGVPIGGVSGSVQAGSVSTTQAATGTDGNKVAPMNFRQLQESMNKWMLDLSEQEKQFIDQATKVNARDMTLISNGDKIAKLNDSIAKVKSDHARLENALDYLKSQQQEFEMFLEPLEAGTPLNPTMEPEREHLYTLTESVDTQLLQMADDLKEVIRQINETNKTIDKSDPLSQILRILNEHTDALQWVEENSNSVRRTLDEITRQHQAARKDHERSLRTMFK